MRVRLVSGDCATGERASERAHALTTKKNGRKKTVREGKEKTSIRNLEISSLGEE